MFHKICRLLVVCGGLVSLSACQTANVTTLTDATLPAAATISVPVSAPMPNGSPLSDPPAGFVSFCIRYPNQCDASTPQPATITLAPATWRVLEAVNTEVNNAIWPEDDMRHYGRAEYWTIPTDGYGSCHDYALTKRKELIDAGLPQKALRVAIVITPNDERHAVLTVATDRGDYVLDNLRQDLRPWRDAGYQWIARQDATSASGWAALDPLPISEASLAASTTAATR